MNTTIQGISVSSAQLSSIKPMVTIHAEENGREFNYYALVPKSMLLNWLEGKRVNNFPSLCTQSERFSIISEEREFQTLSWSDFCAALSPDIYPASSASSFSGPIMASSSCWDLSDV